MWSEENDKKIRDMMQQEPPYEEKGWEAMMPLLDKHLPQKKNRRRLLLFWLPMLLIPGIIALLLTRKDGQKQTAATEQKVPAATIENSNTRTSASGQTTLPDVVDHPAIDTDSRNDEAGHTTAIPQPLPADQAPVPSSGNTFVSRPADLLFPIGGNRISQQPGSNKRHTQKIPADTDQLEVSTTSPSVAGSTKNTTGSTDHTPAGTGAVTTQAVVNDEIKTSASSAKQTPDTAAKQEPVITTTDTPVSKKESTRKKGFANNFAISLSAGPEYSSTRSFSNGAWRLQYGAGLQYNFSRHFTLRTGFYAGSKVYSAKGSDYHPPAVFWNYYPNLQKVDADCKVYEVPVNLSYSFAAKGNHHFFAAAGVSSVWMKKETYEYYYKDAAGQERSRKRSISNENNHLFSTAQVSAGYQRQLNSRFSLAAEPYMKLPLSGIGYGKVKLKNGGMLLTVSYKPFVKK